MLKIEGVAKRFGSTVALRGVTVSASQGDCLVLWGPSGSGKTTLIRLIAGLERPDAGTITLDGVNLSDRDHVIPPCDRSLGMMFQNLALWPHMTVRDHLNFVLGGKLSGKSEREQRVVWLLERVGLGGKEKRYPPELSGGEQQRLAFARALAPSPRLLLLDEPFTSVDKKLHTSLLEMLGSMRRELDLTLVVATHSRIDLEHLADSAAFLTAGEIEAVRSRTKLEEYLRGEAQAQ